MRCQPLSFLITAELPRYSTDVITRNLSETSLKIKNLCCLALRSPGAWRAVSSMPLRGILDFSDEVIVEIVPICVALIQKVASSFVRGFGDCILPKSISPGLLVFLAPPHSEQTPVASVRVGLVAVQLTLFFVCAFLYIFLFY